MAKEYGNIYSLWGGDYHCIVLCGYQAVKEVLIDHSEAFVDRLITPYISAATKEKGIVCSNGHTWKQQRRFGIITMRKLGLGKKGVESQIQEEAQELVEFFAATKGQPFDPSLSITKSFANVICAATFGHRFSTEDKDFLELTEASSFIVRFGSSFHYLSKDDPDSTYNEDNLVHCIIDLFIGGTDTTSGFLKWALLAMANHLDIQDKVYEEMEEVFSLSHTICYEDRKKLPYTNAVIHEIMRSKYIMLFGLPRQSVQDIYSNGFLIPKGAIIFADLRSVLFDPEHWEAPEEFNPNHFLDKEGHFVIKEAFLPFGAGARVCLGELLAKMELFNIFTRLLRAFRFQPPEGVGKLSEKLIIGATVHPPPYKICAVPRIRTP
ncbi:hypothetical protein Chor_014530 [Crotalus horridus]